LRRILEVEEPAALLIRAGWPRPLEKWGVMMRKDKRIRHKLFHAAAFAATGSASGIVTAAEAANHAGYNARTRKLQAEAGERDETETGAASEASEVQQVVAAAKAQQQSGLRGMRTQIDAMNADELRELVTMPNGKPYSYWLHGSRMTAQQRVILGMASRRLSKLERPA
jgi:hypothetical protein